MKTNFGNRIVKNSNKVETNKKSNQKRKTSNIENRLKLNFQMENTKSIEVKTSEETDLKLKLPTKKT